jgi:hypothetical protein
MVSCANRLTRREALDNLDGFRGGRAFNETLKSGEHES